MNVKDLVSIPTMKEFNELLDSLNLTDRQRKIAFMRYSRGMRNIDIAEELDPPVCQDTITDELKVIRSKLAHVCVRE